MRKRIKKRSSGRKLNPSLNDAGLDFRNTLNALVSVFLLSLLLHGCALFRPPPQQTVLLPALESREIISDFKEVLERQADCGCCLDAEVSVTFSASTMLWNRAGTLDGYLLAASPSFFKFIAVNPLGQPLLLIGTSGETFTSVIVPENKAYIGVVHSKTFTKYAPKGFNPEQSYGWLTGRLQPVLFEIISLRRGEEEGSYWLDIRFESEEFARSILFNPERGVITRHIVMDDKGRTQMDVRYGEFISRNAESCLFPGRITVSGLDHNGKVAITLHSVIPDASLQDNDFKIKIPSSFEQVIVE